MDTNKSKENSSFLKYVFPKCKLLSFTLLGLGLTFNVALGETPVNNNELLDQRPGVSSASNKPEQSRPGVSTSQSRPGVSGSSRPGISSSSRPGIGGTVGLAAGVSLSRPGISAASRPGIERDQALGLRQVGEASTQVKRAVVVRTGPEVQLEVADNLVEAGKLKEAIANYQKVIDKNPNLAAAYAGLGYAYVQTEDFDQAITNLTIALEKNKDDSESQLYLGVALYRSGEIKAAIEQYNKLVDAKSQNPDVYYNLGIAYSHEGNFDQAIEQINTAINKRKNKKYPEAYNNLGLIYEATGDLNKAVELFQTAIEQQNGKYPTARYNLARVYLNKAADKEGKLAAIKQYQKATQEDPQFAEAYLELGTANLFLSVHSVEHINENALAAYTKAIELRKGIYPLAHENMAIVYSKMGRKEDAMKQYYLAFEQYDGRCPEALQNMISTLNDDQFFTITNELLKSGNAGSLINKNTSKAENKVAGSVEEIVFRTMKNLVSYENIDDEKKDTAIARYCGGRAYAFIGDWESATKEFTQALILAKKGENQPAKTKGKEDNEQINISEDAQRALITIASNNLVAILPQ